MWKGLKRVLKKILWMLALVCFSSLSMAKTLVFDYKDFGPPSMAYQTIGTDWFQWNNHGFSRPSEVDQVSVVVYWSEPLSKVKKRYVISQSKKLDYRYLSYQQAISYLNRNIREIEQADEPQFQSLLLQLAQTKMRLEEAYHALHD